MSDEGGTDYWAILDPIWEEQAYGDESDKFWDWFNNLSEPQKVLFPTHWLHCEVLNGGFHQYFANSTGFQAPEAVKGLFVLGLDDIAQLVERAIAVFGEPFPRERALREEFLWPAGVETGEEFDPFLEMNDGFFELLKIPGASELGPEDRFSRAADIYARRFLT
jgi:hypothetical protein